MATVLNKVVLRESTIEFDNRNILVSLEEDQSIKFKLKGMKSGDVSISIEALYKQLTGNDSTSDSEDDEDVLEGEFDEVEEPKKKKKGKMTSTSNEGKNDKKAPMINLNDLRSLTHVTPMDTKTLILLDSIIKELIENTK